MAARKTTTDKEETKTKATKAKTASAKAPAKRGRPRKVKLPEGEADAETGVKLYNPKLAGDATPFSFDVEDSSVSSQKEDVPASVESEGEAVFAGASESLSPVLSAQEETEGGSFEASEQYDFAEGAVLSPVGTETVSEVSADAEAPSEEPAASSLYFSKAFEPVSNVSEGGSASDDTNETDSTPVFASLSDGIVADDRREVEFELAQERISSTMAALVESQRAFFYTGQTRDVNFRILQLKKLYRAIQDNEGLLIEALQKDLAKSPSESYSTEIGLVLHEISFVIRHLKKWVRPKQKLGDLHLFPARFKIYREPVGVSLIMSTWNYPVLLSLGPIISSVAAGNTVVLKTSEYADATNAVLKALIEKTFNRSFMAVVQGGYTENHALLEQHFDFIFFTGSQNVGRIVMSSAARFLTPVCLELGGKSPCIVDSSANLEIAARRIVWGKFLNAGQTCVAPDYILVDKGVKDKLISLMQGEILRQYGDKPLENKDYPKIINERRFVHLSTLCPKAEMDFVTNKISPTIMDLGDMNGKVAREAEVMQEEIFGPLLPVLSFDNINSVMGFVSERSVPLSLYIFSTNAGNIRRVTQELRFGGGCVNDVVFHLASSKAPFGGEGESGMGNYHGIYGFETFSHTKTILVQSPKKDFNFRYAPFTEKSLRLFRRLLR